MSRFLYIFLLLQFPFLLSAQNALKKKELGHEELVSWNKIIRPQLSNDGNWALYTLKAEEGDPILKIYDAVNNQITSFDRGEHPKISADSRFVLFKIQVAQDSIKALRRKKVDKKNFPKAHLGIYDLEKGTLDTIKNIRDFKVPEKWSGWIAYQKEHIESTFLKEVVIADSTIIDTTKVVKSRPLKKKKNKHSFKLHFRNLLTQEEKVYPAVLDYQFAENKNRFAFTTTGNDSTLLGGVYLFDCTVKNEKALWRQKGKFKQLTFDESGTQLAFHANFDTTDAQIPPFELLYWKEGQDTAHSIATNQASFLEENWRVSEHGRIGFSDNGSKLFFGIAPNPILQDTSLLEEEIVSVEVWHWNDPKLYPQQEVQKDREEKRAYTVVWHPQTKRFVQLGSLDAPNTRASAGGNASHVIAYNENPYYKSVSWNGGPAARDVYLINTKTGAKKEIAKKVNGSVSLSPAGKYAFAYISPDSAWYSYEVQSGKITQMTDNKTNPFYDELNDRPMHPRASGFATWTANDKNFLVYDRYDIWKIDPRGMVAPKRLTNGREKGWQYRYIRLDREKWHVEENERMLLKVFDEETRESGYAWLDNTTGNLTSPTMTKHYHGRRVVKAKNSDKLLFTQEDFRTFPDLQYSNLNFDNPKKISDANPQQHQFHWGTMEPYTWTSLDGQSLDGLLVKPDNFDPNKKYPLIVNFYERSSDGLYRHRAPFPHRSTINYSFYVSKGYVIFNPDIPYKIGYPGESCYNAVMSGVTALLKEGFVDKERIGVQGHSWGGYQIAHLLTKTDIFKCAESGAPVVNMFSAYGGIRWGSGMSRMFQYEKTQSRIGGTIWEYPLRYIENSPIFEMDKTNTPVLILHNDKDGAVPWYQGIEYFVALRRLNKPAWLLNYNGEPHWPVKLENRKDFNIRMQQYFDYYLQDAAMPVWMERGVPAIEKGIRQGLELVEKE